MLPCIWYVSKYVITPSDGEPAGRGYGLMREFARLGYQSVIVTSDSMGKFDAPVVEHQFVREEHEGITLCRLRTLKYADSNSLRRILSWVDFERGLFRLPKEALPSPDVIVVSSLSLLTVLNGLRLRRRYKCRLVFEVRDIWPLTLVEEGGFGSRNPVLLALGAVEKLGYRRADAIVGTMPNLGAHVKNVTGRSIPTSCIPMGVDVASIQTPEPLPADYVETYIPTDKFLVAYAGSIGISNAMDTFFDCVESMRQDQDIHFVVLGDGELRQSYVDRYGSLPNLTFAPRVPKAQVHDFLTRCDLLYLSVHNSEVWDYGQSLNKLIDYMLAAKPVVASYSGYPSMIDEAECGTFVPAGDAAALREEIRRFAVMAADDREVMGESGRTWLLAERNYRALAEKYLAILLPQRKQLPAPTGPQEGATVLHLTHTSVPDDARILRELNALSETSDLRIHAYGVLEGEAPTASKSYTLTEFRVRSAPALRLSSPAGYALVMLEVNARFVARMLKLRPDIVHCHDTMVLPAGALAKLLLRSTVVYDAHELESDKAGQSRALSKATLLIEKVSWPRIDRLITVSPSIADWYAKHLGPKPTTCIFNSPEVSSGRHRPEEASGSGLRHRLGIEQEVPLFVYVGALETGRGIELLLEAFGGSAIKMHVAFIGSGGLRATIERASELHDNIHYCPPVPHDELVDFIREATGGFCLIEDVSLSDHYCLPNKLFEYAFAGLPVIASRLPDIERFVDDYQLGVCVDLSTASIRAAALECAATPRDLPLERLEAVSWASQANTLKALYSGWSRPSRRSRLSTLRRSRGILARRNPSDV